MSKNFNLPRLLANSSAYSLALMSVSQRVF
jgi:hypothetical protein